MGLLTFMNNKWESLQDLNGIIVRNCTVSIRGATEALKYKWIVIMLQASFS